MTLVDRNGRAKGVAASSRRTDAEPKRDRAWAAETLIKGLGVPSDLLGSPPLRPEHITIMTGVVVQMPAAERKALRAAAVGLQLSNWHDQERCLPETFERELIKVIDRLG